MGGGHQGKKTKETKNLHGMTTYSFILARTLDLSFPAIKGRREINHHLYCLPVLRVLRY